MTSLFLRIQRSVRDFVRREEGNLTFEAAVLFPMLVWTVTMTFSFFDAFRQSTANLKASYTVGDLVSRETNTVTDQYVSSMYVMLRQMVGNQAPLKMRMTFIMFQEDDDRHFVDWSSDCGFGFEWDDDNIHLIRDRLPPMSDLDTLIIVETTNDYDPVFKPPLLNGWLNGERKFENFVFTRPRFTDLIPGNVSAQGCQQNSLGVPATTTS